MEWTIISASGLFLMLAGWLLWQCRRAGKRADHESYVGRLEEVARAAELTRRRCLTSLESLERRVDALQSWASGADHRLGGLTDPGRAERKEHYQAAALLLARGNSVEQVSAMLALPRKRVELIQELKNCIAPEGAPPPAPLGEPPSKSTQRGPSAKPAGGGRRKRVRPILLTDVVTISDAGAEAAA